MPLGGATDSNEKHKPFHALRARLARGFGLNARASRLSRDLAFLKFTRIRVESRVDRVTTRARGTQQSRKPSSITFGANGTSATTSTCDARREVRLARAREPSPSASRGERRGDPTKTTPRELETRALARMFDALKMMR